MDNANDLLSRIEAARLWNYFHKDWLLQIRLAVRRQLPADYRVFVESEAVLITPEHCELAAASILPDISLARAVSDSTPEAAAVDIGNTSTALIEAEEPCDAETHYSLVIRRAPENHVVAAAEILSPSHKGRGNRLSRADFQPGRAADGQSKCGRTGNPPYDLDAAINLLEIDALTQGHRIVPDRLLDLGRFERVAWTAFHDAGLRRFRGWGWNEPDQLPEIAWRIDLAQTVKIDLASTLSEAAEFNQWDALARPETPN